MSFWGINVNFVANLLFFFGKSRKFVVKLRISSMNDKQIYSKEWCDIVFEGRNKDYGAYVLRRDTGHRYRVVMRVLAGVIIGFLLISAALGFYIFTQIKQAIEQLDEVTKLERLKPRDGTEFHDVAQGRRAIPNMKPGASMSKPEIVEGIALTLELGIDGPEPLHTEDDLLIVDHDSLHNRNQLDVPEEGALLRPTEVVEEMPKFPGGIGELMKWLDTHIIYTAASMRAKIEGDMEVTFLVDANGKVCEPKVTKTLTPSLDRMVISALANMPQWEPGRSNGRISVVQITLPIHFQLK